MMMILDPESIWSHDTYVWHDKLHGKKGKGTHLSVVAFGLCVGCVKEADAA